MGGYPPLPDSVSSELMRLIGEAQPHEFSLAADHLRNPYIEIRGWGIRPFCDAGDLDYIDVVETPDGAVYDVAVTYDMGAERWVGEPDGSVATGLLFNWAPPAGLVPWEACPCGYRTCWSTAYMKP